MFTRFISQLSHARVTKRLAPDASWWLQSPPALGCGEGSSQAQLRTPGSHPGARVEKEVASAWGAPGAEGLEGGQAGQAVWKPLSPLPHELLRGSTQSPLALGLFPAEPGDCWGKQVALGLCPQPVGGVTGHVQRQQRRKLDPPAWAPQRPGRTRARRGKEGHSLHKEQHCQAEPSGCALCG